MNGIYAISAVRIETKYIKRRDVRGKATAAITEKSNHKIHIYFMAAHAENGFISAPHVKNVFAAEERYNGKRNAPKRRAKIITTEKLNLNTMIRALSLNDALSALCARVTRAEEKGEKNLIFCEDRLTLLTERSLVQALGGTFLTDVTTFARFLSGEAKVLSKQGSVMVTNALLQACEGQTTCFGKGSAGVVYETIAQLSASRVDAQMLRTSAEGSEGMLRAKLTDLALLQEKYEEALFARGMVDENGYLGLLPEKIASNDLRDCNVYFFAFPSFTRQAQEGIRAALEHCKSVTGIFLSGDGELYTDEARGVFARVCEEYGGAETVSAPDTLTGDALALREGLFSPDRFSLPPRPCEGVYSFLAQDCEEELQTVAALIKKHIYEGARYRDIAVLVPDESAFPVAEKVFGQYRIPFFADRKRKLSEHPFCAFALALLNGAADGILPAEADAVAANPYFGKGDVYRNYLLKFGGYRGAVKREIKEGEAVKGYDRAYLCVCRERATALFGLFPRSGRGEEYARAVADAYEFCEGDKVTQNLQAYCSREEKEFLSPEPIFRVLQEIGEIAGGQTFTAREFCDLLKSGLEACSLSLIPQHADAVFVGDATESKFARVKILFATGMTAELPRTVADTAVISDAEIKRLSQLQVKIEPAIAQVNARARESLALNLCSFTERLYLSRPLRNKGGETQRGEVLQYAERMFHLNALPDLFPFDCCEKEAALLKLLAFRGAFEEGREKDGSKFSALYAALCQAGERTAAEALLSESGKGALARGEELYFSQGTVSPTLLEQYFSCPYAGFAMRGLRLREREERTVLDTDTGTFIHTVLEETARRFNEFLDEPECRAYAEAAGSALLQTPRFSSLADTKAGEYTAERLIEEGEEVAAAAYRQLTQSAFRVRAAEESVSLPELALAGKADRVDESGEYVRVIDYKTGAIDDKAVSYYTGRKLQLQLYLKAVSKGKRAAGAFYFPAADSFTRDEDEKFRMTGFYNGEDAVLTLHDRALQEGEKSALFDGRRNGKFTDKGMSEEDFHAFLDYSVLVSAQAEREMKEGNISPSPYDGACRYCKLKGLCAYDGEPRKVGGVKCADIVKIVKRERGEEV